MQQNQKQHLFALLIVLVFTCVRGQHNYEDIINVVCPPSEDGLAVFVPHPYDCQKYFLCQFSTGILMSCPGNLQFDPILHVCNYPEVVGCENSTPKPPPTTTTEAPPDNPQPTNKKTHPSTVAESASASGYCIVQIMYSKF